MNLIPISILMVSLVCLAIYWPVKGKRLSFSSAEKRRAKLATEAKRRKEKSEKLVKAVNEINKYWREVAGNNITGTGAEKSGDIEKAIIAYETNVTKKAPAEYPYNRLMAIYHHQQRYEDEIRVINTALDVFGTESTENDDPAVNWINRLGEAERLMHQSK